MISVISFKFIKHVATSIIQCLCLCLSAVTINLEASDECINPDYKVPKGFYIRQFCKNEANLPVCVASTLSYDMDSDQLSVQYLYSNETYNFNIPKVCKHYNNGFELRIRVHKKNRLEPYLFNFRTTVENYPVHSKGVQRLLINGKLKHTCTKQDIRYYPASKLLMALCEKIKKNEQSYSLLSYSSFLLSNIDDSSELSDTRYSRFLLSSTDDPSVLTGTRFLTESSSEPSNISVDAIENSDGSLIFTQCKTPHDKSKDCGHEINMQQETARYCSQKGMKMVTIRGGAFCHTAGTKTFKLQGSCPCQNFAFNSNSGLLIIDCACPNHKFNNPKSLFIMENAGYCFDNNLPFFILENHRLGCALGDIAVRVEATANPEL